MKFTLLSRTTQLFQHSQNNCFYPLPLQENSYVKMYAIVSLFYDKMSLLSIPTLTA